MKIKCYNSAESWFKTLTTITVFNVLNSNYILNSVFIKCMPFIYICNANLVWSIIYFLVIPLVEWEEWK